MNVQKYLVDWDKPCRSKVQKKVKDFLREYWKGCIVYEEFPVYGRKRMRVDILNASRKQAVEVHGLQHIKFNKHFHSNSREKFLESISRDSVKYDWLVSNDYHVIEIYENEVDLLTKEWFEAKFEVLL